MVKVAFRYIDSYLAELRTAGPNLESVVRAEVVTEPGRDADRVWFVSSFVRQAGSMRTLVELRVRADDPLGDCANGSEAAGQACAGLMHQLSTVAEDLGLELRGGRYDGVPYG